MRLLGVRVVSSIKAGCVLFDWLICSLGGSSFANDFVESRVDF